MHAFDTDTFYMQIALQEAQRAADAGEVPCGAVIVLDDQIIGKAHNQTEQLQDPTAHAEILAITQATQQLQNWRLNRAVMYVTKEPCPMCAGALVLARIQRVVWGMSDPIRGGAQSKFNILHDADLNHSVEITTGILEEPSREIMQSFFQGLRSQKKDAPKTPSDNA